MYNVDVWKESISQRREDLYSCRAAPLKLESAGLDVRTSLPEFAGVHCQILPAVCHFRLKSMCFLRTHFRTTLQY
jgi:hypothetical protein